MKKNKGPKDWESMYAKLVAFHKKYGHSNVPQRSTEFDGLGAWVSTQRKRKKQHQTRYPPLTQDELDRLTALGFVWHLDRNEKWWAATFERLKEYRRVNGDCLVPAKYDEDPQLGTWADKQRLLNSEGKLRSHRKEKLNNIGFSWVASSNGSEATVTPKSSRKKGDGTFAPKGKPSHEKKGASSKKRDGPDSKNTGKSSRRPAIAKSLSINESDSEEELTGYQTCSWDSEESEKDEPITAIGYNAAEKEKASASDGRTDFNSRMADLDSRKTEDGCLLPRRPPRRKEDGTFARPNGRAPPDKEWDPIRGLYAPKGKSSHEKKGASSIEREEAPTSGSLSGLEEANNGVEMGAEYEAANETSDYETANESLDSDEEPSARKQQELPVGVAPVEPKYPVGTKVREFDEGIGWRNGKVSFAEGDDYEVLYNDGDVETCTEKDLSQIILSPELAKVEVGSRVAALWEDDTYYEASVTRERNKRRPFLLLYDRGDYEWIDLRETKFRLLDSGRKRRRNNDEPLPYTSNVAIEDETIPSRGTKRCKGRPGSSAHPKYDIGTKVKKFFKGIGWYDGKVTSYDGTYYQVSYEDGDCEEHNDQSLARIVLSPDLSRVDVDTRVAVQWRNNGKYYEATVVRECDREQYPFCLVYDTGGAYEWVDLRERKFRLLGEGTRILDAMTDATKTSAIEVGSRLAVLWPDDGAYYGATLVEKRNRKECFCLEYDDGDTEWTDLSKRKFRLLRRENR